MLFRPKIGDRVVVYDMGIRAGVVIGHEPEVTIQGHKMAREGWVEVALDDVPASSGKTWCGAYALLDREIDAESVNAIQLLEDIRMLLRPAGAWTQGTSARDERGEPVLSRDSIATCWCLSGAAWKIGGDGMLTTAKTSDRVAGLLGFRDSAAMIAWNDVEGRRKCEVEDKISEGIARIKERAAAAAQALAVQS